MPVPFGFGRSEAALLPFIDEHRQAVEASADEIWSALLEVLSRRMRGSALLARLLGCDPRVGSAEFLGRPGESVPGVRVLEAEPGRRLALRGKHRFADYALTFEIEDHRLTARTHADFPGLQGRLYRLAVITTGAHAVITRHLLRRVAAAH